MRFKIKQQKKQQICQEKSQSDYLIQTTIQPIGRLETPNGKYNKDNRNTVLANYTTLKL